MGHARTLAARVNLTAIVVGALGTGCVARDPDRAGRIDSIRGNEVSEESQISAMAVAIVDQLGTVMCSGSLIDEVTVLTASHCFATVTSFVSPNFYVFFGTNTKSIKMKTDFDASPKSPREMRPKVDEADDRIRKIAFVHQHEASKPDVLMPGNPVIAPAGETYAWGHFGVDAALLKLDKPAPESHPPVPLYTGRVEDLAPDARVISLGYGRGTTTEGEEFLTGQLRQFPASIRSVSKRFGELLIEGHNGARAYFGDSGGPLLVFTLSKGWKQVGIVSHPAAAEGKVAEGRGKDIYIAIPSLADWIQKNAKGPYCKDYVVSDRTRKVEEGYVDFETGRGGVLFRGQNVFVSDAKRQIWKKLNPGDKLERFLKGPNKDGFIGTIDLSQTKNLTDGQRYVLGFVDNFFMDVAEANPDSCIN